MLSNLVNVVTVYIFNMNFDACRDYRRPPAGPSGAPRDPSGVHLTMFDKYVKKCKTWKMSFWGLLDENYSISKSFIGVFEEP